MERSLFMSGCGAQITLPASNGICDVLHTWTNI